MILSIGYVRVSKADPHGNGASPEAQRTAIKAEADRRGWKVQWVEDRGYSGKSLQRPGISAALDLLDSGKAQAIIAARLDRLSRSVHDFAGLLERSQRKRWTLIVLDINVDTSTPAGEAMANVMAAFSQYERRLIGQRTKEALAVKRAQGVRLGRPPSTPPAVVNTIAKDRAAGLTLQAIADRLNDSGVPTPAGHNAARWHPRTISKLLARTTKGDPT